MAIELHELIFDPATLEGAKVGSYLIDADGHVLDINADGSLQVAFAPGAEVELGATTLAALENITVSATDLDIRNLVFADDKVDVTGSTVELGSTSLAALENITVTVSSEVEIKNDSGNPVPVSESFGNIKHSKQTVNNTASQLAATALANRSKILVQNLGSKDIFIGTSTVTAATGVKIPSGGNVELPYNASVALYAITSSGNADVRILEAA